MWFLQDGATCHIDRGTIDLLKETFNDKDISINGHVNQSPRLCDLTYFDFFLWSYDKAQVYDYKPENLESLKMNIKQEITEMGNDLCEGFIENQIQRIHSFKRFRGGHLHDFVFDK